MYKTRAACVERTAGRLMLVSFVSEWSMVILVELVTLFGLVRRRNATSNSTLRQPGSKQRRQAVCRHEQWDQGMHHSRLSRWVHGCC